VVSGAIVAVFRKKAGAIVATDRKKCIAQPVLIAVSNAKFRFAQQTANRCTAEIASEK
jgi:hypothetical protein